MMYVVMHYEQDITDRLVDKADLVTVSEPCINVYTLPQSTITLTLKYMYIFVCIHGHIYACICDIIKVCVVIKTYKNSGCV